MLPPEHPLAAAAQGAELDMALQLGDLIPVVGAGPEQVQIDGARVAASRAQYSGASAEARDGSPARPTDGLALPPAVVWPGVGPSIEAHQSVQPAPLPISASPAGWDGEATLHAPTGTRVI